MTLSLNPFFELKTRFTKPGLPFAGCNLRRLEKRFCELFKIILLILFASSKENP